MTPREQMDALMASLAQPDSDPAIEAARQKVLAGMRGMQQNLMRYYAPSPLRRLWLVALAIAGGFRNTSLTFLMGILSFLGLGEKRVAAAAEYYATALGVLGEAFAPATPILKEEIPEWNLSSVPLLQALGYICGFLDAAYQNTNPSRYDESFVEELFLRAVERNLGWVPKIDVFLTVTKTIRTGHISGLLSEPGFRPGMLVGGDDFVKFMNDPDANVFPIGLRALLCP
jgi:hypothetical protein